MIKLILLGDTGCVNQLLSFCGKYCQKTINLNIVDVIVYVYWRSSSSVLASKEMALI